MRPFTLQVPTTSTRGVAYCLLFWLLYLHFMCACGLCIDGDRFPPYLFLLNVHQSAEGGENALVNSNFVVEEMERSGDHKLVETARLLRTVPVDQTQYGANGATGIPCVSPIVQTLPNGRMMVKMATSSQHPATAEQKKEAKADAWQAEHSGQSLEER